MKLSKDVVIIDVESLGFVSKDIIVIKDWEDFIFLLSGTIIIYKVKNTYYNIMDSVAYLYNEK